MSRILNDRGHLSPLAIVKLKEGTLTDTELLQASAHIASCESCADILAGSFAEDELSSVPSGFLEEVASKMVPKKMSKKQLAFYSIRVAVAACAALVMVAFGNSGFVKDMYSKSTCIKAPDLSFVDSINSDLNSFSKKILYMEVFNNAKKEK